MLDCPLRELNLVGRSPATDEYRFTLGPKPTLPSAVVTYAVLDYVARRHMGGNTITLSHLAYEPGAPGHTFKLTESELLSALELTIHDVSAVDITAPTGAHQMSWKAEPARIAIEILNDHYDVIAADYVRGGRAGDLPVESFIREALLVDPVPTDVLPSSQGTHPAATGAL